MSYCPNCGTQIASDAKFCEDCGKPVSTHTQEAKIENGSPELGVSKQWSFGNLFTGRLGRMRYFQGLMLSFGPFVATLFLWGFIHILSGTLSTTTGDPFIINIFNNVIVPLLFAFEFIGMIIFYFPIAIRRSHDIGYTGWLTLCTGIPYIGVIFGLIFLFKKGNDGVNKYGPPPVKGRKFLADVFNY